MQVLIFRMSNRQHFVHTIFVSPLSRRLLQACQLVISDDDCGLLVSTSFQQGHLPYASSTCHHLGGSYWAIEGTPQDIHWTRRMSRVNRLKLEGLIEVSTKRVGEA